MLVILAGDKPDFRDVSRECLEWSQTAYSLSIHLSTILPDVYEHTDTYPNKSTV